MLQGSAGRFGRSPSLALSRSGFLPHPLTSCSLYFILRHLRINQCMWKLPSMWLRGGWSLGWLMKILKRFRAPDALQLVAQYGVELRRFDLQHGFRVDRCSGAQLNSAGRHWVRTLKRRFGISRRYLPLAEPLSADHVQTKAGPEPNFWNFFFVVL